MAFSKAVVLALTTYLSITNALSIEKRLDIAKAFKSSLTPGTKIFFPSDPNYANETTQRWTVYEEPTYVAAIKPANENDVRSIVKIAGSFDLPYLATGGGHGLSTTLNNLKNGISIDLGNFKKVTVDTKANTVTVGGANVFGDVFGPVWDAGREMATGSCACPGIAGATIGGGVGRLQGLHGLIIDNLISATVVTAKGDIVTVSETQNPDLFWGIRGAGASFGIILWATYKIYPQTNGGMALNADFIFPANASDKHWEILKEVEVNMPPELALISGINYNEARGGVNVLFNAVYYGPEAKGRALLQKFIQNNPITTKISYVKAKTLVDVAAFGLFGDAQCAKGRHVNTYTVGATAMDPPTWKQHFKNFTELYTKFPQARASNAFLETFSNRAVLNAKKGSTSVPQSQREITNYILWGYNYADASIDTQINAFASDARTAFTATSGFPSLSLYVTYAHGDEGPDVWYREQLPRLKQVKKKWDPQARFGFMNPVPAK